MTFAGCEPMDERDHRSSASIFLAVKYSFIGGYNMHMTTIWIYIYMYTHTHTYIYIHTYAYICLYLYVYMYVYIFMFTYSTYIYIYVYIYIYIYIICLHLVCMYIYIYIHVYIHVWSMNNAVGSWCIPKSASKVKNQMQTPALILEAKHHHRPSPEKATETVETGEIWQEKRRLDDG